MSDGCLAVSMDKSEYDAMDRLIGKFHRNTGVYGGLAHESITVHIGGKSLVYNIPDSEVDLVNHSVLSFVQESERYEIRKIKQVSTAGTDGMGSQRVVIQLVELL